MHHHQASRVRYNGQNRFNDRPYQSELFGRGEGEELTQLQDIACSDFHTFAAVAGSDGVCAVLNPLRRIKRGSHAVSTICSLSLTCTEQFICSSIC